MYDDVGKDEGGAVCVVVVTGWGVYPTPGGAVDGAEIVVEVSAVVCICVLLLCSLRNTIKWSTNLVFCSVDCLDESG